MLQKFIKRKICILDITGAIFWRNRLGALLTVLELLDRILDITDIADGDIYSNKRIQIYYKK